jgi:large subunit ribosomal protein L25
MDQIELNAETREITGKKVKQLRAEGLMPLVVYGGKVKPLNIQAVEFDVKRTLARTAGQLIALRVEGESDPRMVLARDIQRDVLSGQLLHADLYQVDMTEMVQVDVTLAFTGEAHLVSIGEAILATPLTSVEVECLPGDIVQSIEVDISSLVEMDDAIYVRDLQVPEGLEILTDEDELIARMEYVIEEEEEEEEEEFVLPSVDEVEVIGERREDEEEAEIEEEE